MKLLSISMMILFFPFFQNFMNICSVTLLIAAASVAGCGYGRNFGILDLDWSPSKLSSSGCPNLNGDYKYNITRYANGGYSDDLFYIYAGSAHDFWSTLEAGMAGHSQNLRKKDKLSMYQSYFDLSADESKREGKMEKHSVGTLHIDQKKNLFVYKKTDQPPVVTEIGTDFAGCGNGSLVLRNLNESGGGDFVPRAILYGELEISKEEGGVLSMTLRRRQVSVAFATGTLGASKVIQVETRTYLPKK